MPGSSIMTIVLDLVLDPHGAAKCICRPSRPIRVQLRVDLGIADSSRLRLTAGRSAPMVDEVSHEADSGYRLRDSGRRTRDCRVTRRTPKSEHEYPIPD